MTRWFVNFLLACLLLINANTICFTQIISSDFINISTLNNLSSSSVTDIAQDHFGFIWIATSDGLNKYDGYSIKEYKNILNDSNSLCDNKVSDLLIDSKGRLWVGTENNGLCLYNEKNDNFVHYPYFQEDNRTLSFRFVTSIEEDNDGNIWVATLKGLNKYDEKNNKFIRVHRELQLALYNYSFDRLRSGMIPNDILNSLIPILDSVIYTRQRFKEKITLLIGQENTTKYYHLIEQAAFTDIIGEVLSEQIRDIAIDVNNNVWLGLERNGISMYNSQEKVFKDFKTEFIQYRVGRQIYKVTVSDSLLWVYSEKGLNIFKIVGDTIVHLLFDAKFVTNSTCILPHDKAWLSTNNELYLFEYNRHKNVSTKTKVLPSNISDNTVITCLFADRQNLLWFGTNNNGLYYSNESSGLTHFNTGIDSKARLSYKDVLGIAIDKKQNFWIYYSNGFVELWNSAKLNHQNTITSLINSQNSNFGGVKKVFVGSNNRIWLGTSEGILWEFNTKSRKIDKLDIKRTLPDFSADIVDIDEDKYGNLWLSLHGGGLIKLEIPSKKISHYPANPQNWMNSLANDWIFSTYIDSAGYLYIGTVDGLSIAHIDSMNFTSYNTLLLSKNRPSHNLIEFITGDKHGNIWLATANGLNHFNVLTRKFTKVPPNQRLINSHILGIVCSNDGKELWISTKKGITKLLIDKDLRILGSKNYDVSLGKLQTDWLRQGVCARNNEDIIFGGKEGLIVLKPSKFKENKLAPSVRITNINLFNKPLDAFKWGKNSDNKKLVLKHSENVLSIDFTAINYIQSEKNQYAFQLIGFDKRLRKVKDKRQASYTNLSPGEYTFKVIASNNDGYWNKEGDSIQITVLPPVWRTSWAYFIYIILILLIVFVINRTLIGRERLRNEIKLQDYKLKKDKDLNAAKLRFFTNISHEFRTPLTLMIGPVEKLLNHYERLSAEDANFYFRLIHSNSKKLLKLINQLMDFRKLENKSYRLDKKHGNLIKYVRSIFDQFAEEAKTKNISYQFTSNIEKLFTDFDDDVIDKICINLISNAFKYTSKNGAVSVNILFSESNSGQLITIEVEDNGIGIPKEKQAEIFTRFYQMKHKESISSGIGLDFTKELVELHGGTISLESEPNRGAKFSVKLPIDKDESSEETVMLIEDPENINSENHQTIQKDKKLSILLVDDTEDILTYLEKELSDQYNISKAHNGIKGIELAKQNQPDFIISDILMPQMDGIEMSKMLKGDINTSHIPIILLTAKSAEESVLEGLSVGVDDYIKKPFNPEILKIKINNILERRRITADKFTKDFEYIPKDAYSNEKDNDFIERATKLVLDNIGNSKMDAEFLVTNLGMSKTVLYTKLKSLTGQSINEFIRIIRLKKAVELIQKGEGKLSNIAFDVGFNSLSYFTSSFTKHFGKSPTEFFKS